MIAIQEIQQLSKEELGLVTVLTGEDLGQYSQTKQALMEAIAFDATDLTYSYFDMAETDYATAALDLESLPFFADQKVVIFDNLLDITTQKKSYLSEQDLAQFEAYLANPLDTTRLIILAPGKLDVKRRLVKFLKRDGHVYEANSLKEADLRSYFTAEAKKQGLTISSPVFELLLAKSNFDFSELTKNLAFLRAYKTDGQISESDIEEAIPKTLQDNIFELSQYILKAKVEPARSLVADLRLQGEDEIKLTAILLNQFRTFLQVSLLADKGLGEPQIVAELSELLGRKVNPFQVKFALRDSRSLSINYLKKAVFSLIETDYQMKTGRYEKDYLFDILLLKLTLKEI